MIAALMVPILILAGLAWGASETLSTGDAEFSNADETALGTPRRAELTQDGSTLVGRIHLDGMPRTPPDGAGAGLILRPSPAPRVRQAQAVAIADNGTMEYTLLNGTDGNRPTAPEARSVWYNQTYSRLQGPHHYPYQGPLPPRIDVALWHGTAPGGANDLNLSIRDADNRTLASSDMEAPGMGVAHENLSWPRDVEVLRPVQIVVAGAPGPGGLEKPNRNVNYTLMIRLRFDLIETGGGDGPERLRNLTGRYDPDGGFVEIEIPADALLQEPDRGRVTYSAFVIEDGGVAAQTGRRQFARLELKQGSVDHAFVSGVLRPMQSSTTLIALFATSISVFLVYGRELSRGPIRSLFHYPLSYLEVHAAKAGSSLLPGFLITGAYAGLVLPLQISVFDVAASLGLAVIALTFLMVLVSVAIIAAWAWGLSTIWAWFTGRMTLAFHRMFLLVFVAAVLTTETVLEFLVIVIPVQFALLGDPDQIEAFQDAAEAIAPVSPIHAAGRWLSNLAGQGQGLALHFVVPITIGLVAAGLVLGRELYPDVLLEPSSG